MVSAFGLWRRPARAAAFLVLTGASVLLAACGGSGGGNAPASNPSAYTLKIDVRGTSGTLSNATVVLPVQGAAGATNTATLGSEGFYVITTNDTELPPAVVSSGVIVNVSAPGYLARSILYASVDELRSGTPKRVTLEVRPGNDTVFTPTLLDGTAVVAAIHLGDADQASSFNAKLQGSATAPSLAVKLLGAPSEAPTVSALAGKVLVVTGQVRGVEPTSVNCNTKLVVYQDVPAARTVLGSFVISGSNWNVDYDAISTGRAPSVGGVEPPAGSRLEVAGSLISAGSPLWVSLEPGDCISSPTVTNLDNFEFKDLKATLEAAP